MFSFVKKLDAQAVHIAALRNQLESARRRITELTLDNIKQANEIVMLQDYRGTTMSETPRPMLVVGKEMTIPAAAANSEIGLLFDRAAV